MRLLATDYDNTLKTNIKNFKINLDAINKFMEQGNKFVIITGRSFEQIQPEIIKYNIKYDYLVCNNGLIIFDKNNKIVKCKLLPINDINFIYTTLSKFPNLKKIEAYTYTTTTTELNEILEFHGEFTNKSSATDYRNKLMYARKHLYCYQDNNHIYISLNTNKANALMFIQKLEKMQKESIYTIGDDLNDLDMLLYFNGYKMLKSNNKLLFKGIPTIKDVHSLVKKISK